MEKEGEAIDCKETYSRIGKSSYPNPRSDSKIQLWIPLWRFIFLSIVN